MFKIRNFKDEGMKIEFEVESEFGEVEKCEIKAVMQGITEGSSVYALEEFLDEADMEVIASYTSALSDIIMLRMKEEDY